MTGPGDGPTPFRDVRMRGPWSEAEVAAHLDGCRIPLRLSSLSTGGWPTIVSLWFVRRGGSLWCATVDTARVLEGLRRDPRCAFEVAADAPPYRGVRGQGRVHLHREGAADVLRELIGRYLGDDRSSLARWLLGRAEREVAIEIVPVNLASWDYAVRMSRP